MTISYFLYMKKVTLDPCLFDTCFWRYVKLRSFAANRLTRKTKMIMMILSVMKRTREQAITCREKADGASLLEDTCSYYLGTAPEKRAVAGVNG